jgi:histidyl-tRNA synthetase
LGFLIGIFMKIQRPRGTFDILPSDAKKWHFVEKTVRCIANLYGYGEIRTPIFESTDLFVRSVGETTDIVSKEMYSFKDRGGRSITLRPEGTASVIRSYLENSLGGKERLVKLYYLGPIFRYEKPQAGRFRQHHQFGVEAIGSAAPALDAEVIEMVMRLLGELGLKDLIATINSVGCTVCRPGYNKKLTHYLRERHASLCTDCRRRAETNPLRVFDCKQALCQAIIATAPKIGDSLCSLCREHFDAVCTFLDEAGVNHSVKPGLVRGLDYYTRTAFEIISTRLGAQNAVGGGGRYDNLIEMLGGRPTPAIGFGVGLERVLMLMMEHGVSVPVEGRLTVYVAVWENEAFTIARKVLQNLRESGIAAEIDYDLGSLKSQLRRADKLGVPFVVLAGRDEVERGVVRLKRMETGEEREIEVARIGEVIQKESRTESKIRNTTP